VCDLGVDDIQRSNPVEEIMSVLGAQTLLRPNRDVIGLLLAELYSNALEHGLLDLESGLKNTEDGFAEYYGQRQERIENLTDASINIHFELLHDKETLLRIRMTDSGKGFEFQNVVDFNHNDTFGRGISLVHRVCSRLEYSNRGCTVEVDFPVHQAVGL
jgi:two-component sensor histidine kinase